MGKRNEIIVLVIGLLVAVCLPFVIGHGWLSLITEMLIMGVAATAFNLMMGYGGLVSFGPAGQYALGAYVTGVLLVKLDMPFWMCMLIGPLAAGVLSIIIGWFCVRRTEVYFSLLSLAFAQVIYTIILKWYGVTGGDDGLVGIPVPDYLTSVENFYFFTLIITVVSLLVMWKIVRSPFGMVIQGIRENPRRAEFISIDVKSFQLALFTISAFFLGVAGSLYAVFNRSIFPANIDIAKSTDIIVVTLLGGMFNFLGPLLGSAIYILLNKIIANYTEYWSLVLGVVIVFIVLYAKEGAAGFIMEYLPHKKGAGKS